MEEEKNEREKKYETMFGIAFGFGDGHFGTDDSREKSNGDRRWTDNWRIKKYFKRGEVNERRIC